MAVIKFSSSNIFAHVKSNRFGVARTSNPTRPEFLNYLVIGGGGAGANSGQGGGGAGGYRAYWNNEPSGGNSAAYVTPIIFQTGITYNVQVGAGGTAPYGIGNQSFLGPVVAGPGGGGAGSQGGSGGGGSYNGNPGGAALAQQGYPGGAGFSSSGCAGGGGGAGQAGQVGQSAAGGNGGNGLASTITGLSVTRAGGGGGGNFWRSGVGSGGSGGGGSASPHGFQTAAGAGATNTGSGGGDGSGAVGSFNWNGANGGSGVIIVRYPSLYTISQTGLTLSTVTSGQEKITTITAGVGSLSFA